MKAKRKLTHHGQVLQQAVQQSGLSITQLVKRTGYSRSSYYNHIEDPDLSFYILAEYGKALKYDFSADIPGMISNIIREDEEQYKEPKNMAEALRQRDTWREKYYSVLEKYQKILEERLK